MSNLTDTIKAWQKNGTQGPWGEDVIDTIWRGGQQSLMDLEPGLSGYVTNALTSGQAAADVAFIAQAPHMARVVMAAMDLADELENVMEMHNLTYSSSLEALTAFKEVVNDDQ